MAVDFRSLALLLRIIPSQIQVSVRLGKIAYPPFNRLVGAFGVESISGIIYRLVRCPEHPPRAVN